MENIQDQADIRHYIITLWRYKYFIVFFVLLSIVVSFISCRFIEPVYRAEAVVSVASGERPFQSLLSSLMGGFSPPSGFGYNYDVVLRSRTLARRVSKIINLGERLKSSPEAKPPKDSDLVGFLQKGLKISTKEYGTIRIEFEWKKPKLVVDAANAYVKALGDFVNHNSAIQARKYREFVERQLGDAEVELALDEKNHRDFLEEHGMVKVDEELSARLTHYDDLKFQFITTEIALKMLRSKELTIGESLEESEKIPVEVITDMVVGQMRTELVKKELELAEAIRTMNESNPKVVVIREKIDEIRRKLYEHLLESTNAQVASLEVERISLDAKQEGLTSQIDMYEKELSGAPLLVQQYERLRRKVDVLVDVYKMLLKEYESARMAEKKQSDVLAVIDYAEKPPSPAWPNRKMIVTLSMIASFLVAVFLVFLIEYFRKLPPLSLEI